MLDEMGSTARTSTAVHGTDDRFCPVNATCWSRRSRAPLLLPARHAYFIEQRDEATRRVLVFLAAHNTR